MIFHHRFGLPWLVLALPNLHGAGGWACAGAAQSPLGGVGRLCMLRLRRGWRVDHSFY